MIFLLVFFLLIFIMNKKSITGYLSFYIAMSVLAGILISLNIYINSINEIYDLLITLLILFFMIIGFRNYKFYEFDQNDNIKKFDRLFKPLNILTILGLIVNIIIFCMIIVYYLKLGVSIGEFKNGKIAQIFISTSVPRILTITSALLSPLSYIAFGYHFYYLIVKDYKRARLAFLGTLNNLITTLFVFGRGGIVLYLLMYFFYFLLIKHYIDNKYLNKIKKGLFRLGIIFVIPLYLISNNRFYNYSYKTVDPIVKNPILYSSLHYFSQWLEYGLIALNRYTPDLNLAGSSFMYLPNTLLSLFGVQVSSIQLLRDNSLGNLSTSFTGLPAILVYDFGIVGALLFSILYSIAVFNLGPQKGIIKRFNLIYYAFLIPVPLLFFESNFFISSQYNVALVYLLLFRGLYKIKFD